MLRRIISKKLSHLVLYGSFVFAAISAGVDVTVEMSLLKCFDMDNPVRESEVIRMYNTWMSCLKWLRSWSLVFRPFFVYLVKTSLWPRAVAQVHSTYSAPTRLQTELPVMSKRNAWTHSVVQNSGSAENNDLAQLCSISTKFATISKTGNYRNREQMWQFETGRGREVPSPLSRVSKQSCLYCQGQEGGWASVA